MPGSPTDGFVAGLVLGAGGSSRLGRPKQLLRYGDGTLLGHVVGVARDHHPHRLHLVHRGVRRVQQAGVVVEANVAFDAAPQLVLELAHGRDYDPVPVPAQRNCAT